MKKAGFLLPALILTALCLLGWRIYAGLTKQSAAEHNIQVLPYLHLQEIKEPLDTAGKNIVIAYFYPSCEHCQSMAVEIYNNRSLFIDTHVAMVTPADELSARRFMLDYHLDELPFVSMSVDTDGVFYEIFGSTAIPSFYIYNKRRHLVLAVRGETRIETLLEKTK